MQFIGLEHTNNVAGADVEKAAFECLEDVMATAIEAVVQVTLHVLLSIGVSHRNLATIFNQRNAFHHSVMVHRNLEKME